MTIKQFREEFVKIPDEKVGTYAFSNSEDHCCVLGHAMRLTSGRPDDYSMDNCRDWDWGSDDVSNIRHISKKYFKRYDISHINNNKTRRFPQPTAKQRSLAALDELIKAGYGDEEVR